jgi:hypothetical protein
MRKHLWWMMCLSGLSVMFLAILIPVGFWDTGWAWQLGQWWSRVPIVSESGIGFREGFMLIGMCVGAAMVVFGLVLSQPAYVRRRCLG